ncbi:hypothetical protein ACS0TY_020329 [Phlomoides rotata]
MDMNHFRPEFHIAQQSRRDKLRIQNDSNSSPHHNLQQGVYINNLEQQLPSNICYDLQPVFCSEMLGYQDQPPKRVDPGPYQSFSREVPTTFDTAGGGGDPPYFSTWKSIGSQASSDWMPNPSSIFVAHPLSPSSMKISNHIQYQESPVVISNTNYQNALQELVTPSSHAGKVGLEFGSVSDVRMEGWGGNSNTQALSLSLSSSVPSPRVHTRDICAPDDSGTWKKPDFLPNTGRVQTLNHRNPGPLGPFTGYATILTSSKFLRPAQQLLEELCCMARPKDIEICDNRSLEQLLRVSSEHSSMAGDSSASSSFAFNADSHLPENLQKKAKLMYMQDEVCKRYKQYHQQMQMVVSSFESVAGLSAATPYVSLALKMVSKHFRCLKNTITDQLKSIKNSLGEELSSPSSSSKGDVSVSMLKFFDQNFQKQKGAASNLGLLENQHIWRPQRGLPERAVSILRAWLFDHFLHPYPTDTDKHMLATQTGLTRNQVSNWFINARVRVWKPMVEEIHMLETKGGVADQTESDGGKTTLEGCDHQPNDQSSSQSLNRFRMSTIPDKQVECSTSGHEHEVGRSNANIWNQEKRSRIEYHIPSSIDGSLMGLVPSGIEMGGLGSVSLTLGLRQSAENAQRKPEHHLRPHMGGQIIRDFVG